MHKLFEKSTEEKSFDLTGIRIPVKVNDFSSVDFLHNVCKRSNAHVIGYSFSDFLLHDQIYVLHILILKFQ